MPAVDVIDGKKKKAGSMELAEEIFGIPGKKSLVHEVIVMQLANARQGTHSTKTRHFVSGGGAKPWRQKGTGRARAGSSRSPLWRSGGIIHGPHPRDYSYSMPKKAVRHALAMILSTKLKDGELVIMEKLAVKEPRTKEAVAILSGLGLTGGILVLTTGADNNLYLAARNIPNVKVCRVENINAFDLLKYKNLLADRDTINKLQETLK